MPSLKSQFKNDFNQMFKYNTPKHTATPEERKSTIYSKTTRDNYIQCTNRFVDYLRNNDIKVHTKADAVKYVPAYLRNQIGDPNRSAWSVHQSASALAKAYGCKSSDFGVQLPKRAAADIQRGRTETAYSKHFSESKHSDIVNFCKSTGLRRNELEHIKPSDVVKDKNGNYIVNVPGTYAKGGRDRSVLVYNADSKIMQSAIKTIEKAKTEGREHVIGNVSKACVPHNYRSDYAKSLYSKYERPIDTLKPSEIYQCRKGNYNAYDKQAVDKVTQALGHNRLNVTVTNYLNK